jgi:prepilin-type N-terminal cleavage/methylation domain-containing protein
MPKHNARNTQKGFTLIEILLVVVAIAVLAGIVILAINPGKQLGDTRNAQRRADVNTILNALYQYTIDNSGTLPPAITTTPTEICKTGAAYVQAHPAQPAIGWVWLNDCQSSYVTATVTVDGRNYSISCTDAGTASASIASAINADSGSAVTADNFGVGHCSTHGGGNGGYEVCLTAKVAGTSSNGLTVTSSGADANHMDTSEVLSGGAASGSCTGLIDLSVLTDNEKYLTSMPKDPNGVCNTNGICYTISKSANGRMTVAAPNAEQSATISVTR